MAPVKRSSGAATRSAKRTRYTKLIPTVVDAIAASEALPANVRTLLKNALPIVLNINKVERHAYETEVVDQAQLALGQVQAAIEQEHKAALATQNEVIAPAEEAKRAQAKNDAHAHLEVSKTKLETDKAAKQTAEKAVDDAEVAVKTAQKDEQVADKESRRCVDKKDHLSNSLTSEFTVLKDSSVAGAVAKKAVEKLLAIGKEFGLDSTLLNTLPMACKKQVASRTEFESMVFTSLQALIEGQITVLTQKLAELDATKAAKAAARAAAEEVLENAKAAMTAAGAQHVASQTAHKDAGKEVTVADAHLRNIFKDMKVACDKQDSFADDLKNFKEEVWVAFNQLKDKEPEPEAVAEPEPVAEEVVSAGAAEEAMHA